MKIGTMDLDDRLKRVMIVAEIGNNHEGSVALAEELIGLAAGAGADAVKFQTFRTEHYVSPRDQHRVEQLRSFELSIGDMQRLGETARQAGMVFLSTPFDLDSARALEPLVEAYKIASGDNTFYPLLETVAATGKPIILSTGLADLSDINRAKRTIERVWRGQGKRGDLALMHCVSCYPVPIEQANLAAIETLKAAFGCTVGYSDHTLGIEAATFAVAAGARIVEKHFTIDRAHSDFRDHQLSADPEQMARLVREVRKIERILGSGDPTLQPCEKPLVVPLRRSIAAARDLAAGAVLGPDAITWLRPGDGAFPPGLEAQVVGRTLAVPLSAGEMITHEVLVQETAAV